MTTQQAAKILHERQYGATIDEILGDRRIFQNAYHRACHFSHQDSADSQDDFNLLQEAKLILDKHFK